MTINPEANLNNALPLEKKQLGNIDGFFLQLTFALVIIGLAFIVSASWHDSILFYGNPWTFIIRHLVTLCLGIALMLFVSFLHFRWLKHFAWHLVGILLLGLILTMKFGTVSGGARRWLDLGVINLQVSEFVKIGAALIISKTICEKNNRLLALAFVLAMTALVLKQPDLGSSILILSAAVGAYFASGFNLFLFTTVISSFGYLGFQHIIHTPYQMQRINSWLNPESDPLGSGYNLLQSIRAIGSGGVWGLGYGASVQKLGALPISYADFIFAVICEEVGFLGAFAILAIFIAWIMRAFYLCFSSQDEFGKIFGTALTLVFAIQVVINISVTTGLMPITGMTLPLISFGGSSLISSCIITGIIMNISRHKTKQQN